MDTDDIKNLREWSPLTDLLSKIPTRIQKTLFYQDVNITCLDVLSNFIALGTDVGIVFWYNRSTGEVQKLRSELSSPITCVKVVSSVEYMLACGASTGQVIVFQIQKEHPPDLNLVTPLTKPKPIERYTIDLHQSAIRSVEWSKNGMKLFSGDKVGVVILTEFDFQMHISKSVEILNEAYDIVQINYSKPWLLISTVYRATVCECDKEGRWKVSQIGKQDRKLLSDVGAAFLIRSRETSIVCARPGFRLWLSDIQGNVSQTLLFKDTLPKFNFEIPILNPTRTNRNQLPSNFGRCYVYRDTYVVTYSENILFILDLENLEVLASVKRLRNIIGVTLCNAEIFILEGPRSVVRISNVPEPPNKMTSKFYFNAGLTPSSSTSNHTSEPAPVEFEAEEECVPNAEECFELPPIEQLNLKTPLTMSLSEHDLLSQDKFLLEHSKKAEVFEKIGQLEFDSSILFKSGPKKKKSKDMSHKRVREGIVEIGQQAHINEKLTVNDVETALKVETNRPCLLDASFCEGTSIAPDLRSPKTIHKQLELKENKLATTLNIQPVNCEKVLLRRRQLEVKLTPDLAPEFHYPLYPLELDPKVHTTPQKKMFFLQNDDSETPSLANGDQSMALTNISDDIKSTITNEHLSCPLVDEMSDIPEVKKVPDYMKIPNLWNVQLVQPEPEKDNKTYSRENSEGSDWELL